MPRRKPWYMRDMAGARAHFWAELAAALAWWLIVEAPKHIHWVP